MKNLLLVFVLLTAHGLFAQADTLDHWVEWPPRWPGCEVGNCTEKRIMKFVYTNLQNPQQAQDEGIEGRVIIGFVIEIDGSVSKIGILRDIGGGCGAELVRVMELMNKKGIKWHPGTINGVPVAIQYYLPISFPPKIEVDTSH